MKIPVVAAILSMMVPGGVAFFGQGGFTDNSLLTCFEPGPGGISRPEDIRRVPLMPGLPGTVWLPTESG